MREEERSGERGTISISSREKAGNLSIFFSWKEKVIDRERVPGVRNDA